MEISRRHLIGAGTAGAAALAVTATTGIGGIGGDAAFALGDAADSAALTTPVLVHIADAKRGDVSLLVGEREIVFNDPKLVARIARAAS